MKNKRSVSFIGNIQWSVKSFKPMEALTTIVSAKNKNVIFHFVK